MTEGDTTYPEADLSAFDVGKLLNCSAGHIGTLRQNGQLTRYRFDDSTGGTGAYFYDGDEVTALREELGITKSETLISPGAAEFLRQLIRLGGKVTNESGQATSMVADNLPGGYTRQSGTQFLRILKGFELVTVQTRGRRTYEIKVTAAGRAWAKHNLDADSLMPSPPKPEPAPEPEHEAAALPAELPLEDTNPILASTTEPPHTNGHAPEPAFNSDELARALLRQATRVLSDSEVSTLAAERDALRAHNESLVARLTQVTAERDQVAADAREVRAVLHQIEAQLMPMLAGRDARLDWLDATTRADLLRLIGEAARWAV